MTCRACILLVILLAGCLGGEPTQAGDGTDALPPSAQGQQGTQSSYESGMRALSEGKYLEAEAHGSSCLREAQAEGDDALAERCGLVLDVARQRLVTTTTTTSTTLPKSVTTTMVLKLIAKTSTTTPYTEGFEFLFEKRKERQELITTTTKLTTTTQYVTTSTFTVWTTPDYVNKYYIPNPGGGFRIEYPPGVDPDNVADPTEEE